MDVACLLNLIRLGHEINHQLNQLDIPTSTVNMPPKTRKADLRACLICSVIRPLAEFVDEGCPNCEDILEVKPFLPVDISKLKQLLMIR